MDHNFPTKFPKRSVSITTHHSSPNIPQFHAPPPWWYARRGAPKVAVTRETRRTCRGRSVDQRFRASFHPVDLAGRAWINEGGGRPLSIDLRGAGSVKGAASTRRVCIAAEAERAANRRGTEFASDTTMRLMNPAWLITSVSHGPLLVSFLFIVRSVHRDRKLPPPLPVPLSPDHESSYGDSAALIIIVNEHAGPSARLLCFRQIRAARFRWFSSHPRRVTWRGRKQTPGSPLLGHCYVISSIVSSYLLSSSSFVRFSSVILGNECEDCNGVFEIIVSLGLRESMQRKLNYFSCF